VEQEIPSFEEELDRHRGRLLGPDDGDP